MSVTSGFFNSVNGDRRYNAEQMSAIFDGIINDGIFANIGTAFTVKATTGNSVSIGIGRAWFNSTWVYNDAVLPMTLEDSELVLNRIDAIVIEVNYTDTVRAGDIKIVKGTPASDPKRPAMANTQYVHQYPLAYILREPGTSEITQSKITSMIGTSSAPYITGILQVQDIDNIVAQWGAQWIEWYAKTTGIGEEAVEQMIAQWNKWFTEETTESEAEIAQWITQMKADFELWFEDLQVILDGDAAAKLAARILEVEKKFDDLAKEGVIYVTVMDSNGDPIQDSYGTDVIGKTVFFDSGSDEEVARVERKLDDHISDMTLHSRPTEKVVTLYHSKDGIVHSLEGIPSSAGIFTAQFKATAAFAEGDSFADGWIAKPTGEDTALPGNAFVTGDIVTAAIDTESKRLSFKLGGGGGGKNADLPPLLPNMKVEVTEGSTEDIYTVTMDKLVYSRETSMLESAQLEWGETMPKGPGKGEGVRTWGKDAVITYGSSFNGLYLGDVKASDATNIVTIWLPEIKNRKKVLVEYLILNINYKGGVAVARKNGYTTMPISGLTYVDTAVDKAIETTFLNSILDDSIVGQIMKVDYEVNNYSSPTFSRRAVLPSADDMTGTTDFPVFSVPANRIALAPDGSNPGRWTRQFQSGKSYFMSVSATGDIAGAAGASPLAIAPMFVLPKDFKIQERPDGSYTVWHEASVESFGTIPVSDQQTETIVHYLEGENKLVDFIYASSNYNESGGALLVRKNALNAMAQGNIYAPPAIENPYYPDGYGVSGVQREVKKWRDNTLNPGIISKLIPVTVKSRGQYYEPSNDTSPYALTSYTDNAFVLGNDELNLPAMAEGNAGTGLPYFYSQSRLIATTDTGVIVDWSIRDTAHKSPYAGQHYYRFINIYGELGVTQQPAKVNIRPAINVSKDMYVRRLADGSYDLYVEDPREPRVTAASETRSGGSGLSLGNVTPSSAQNETIVWLPENVGHTMKMVPFEVLSTDYLGGVYLMRKTVFWGAEAWASPGPYEGSIHDQYFEKTYVTAVLHESVASSLMSVALPVAGKTITRKAWSPSSAELGRTVSDGVYPVEGSPMPKLNSVEGRLAYNDAGAPVQYATRTIGSNGQIVVVSGAGVITTTNSSPGNFRPCFVLPKDFKIGRRSDGTYEPVTDDPTVTHTIGWPHGKEIVFRQFTRNYKKQWQTMLQGGVWPELSDGAGSSYDPILENNTWTKIAQACADNDPILEAWQIGDEKTDVVDSQTITFVVVDKDHDDKADGTGKAKLTFGMKHCMATTRQYAGGSSTGMYPTTTMFNFINNTLFESMPKELKDAIKVVNKIYNAQAGTPNTSITPARLWLFTEMEVNGKQMYSSAVEGYQYPYYATASNRVKRLLNGSGNVTGWWTSSTVTKVSPTSTVDMYVYIDSSGAPYPYNVNGYAGISFGFCI